MLCPSNIKSPTVVHSRAVLFAFCSFASYYADYSFYVNISIKRFLPQNSVKNSSLSPIRLDNAQVLNLLAFYALSIFTLFL